METILNFIKPEKIKVSNQTDTSSTFEFAPLEPGYGVTVGNALRRILLNSLPGFAVSAVKIEGVKHEFSTIEGIVEDVADIILNLKQVRLQKISNTDIHQEKVEIHVANTTEFKANLIERFNPNFKVTNPDQHILTIDKDTSIKLELYITSGRGYVPSEELKIETDDVQLIKIDSIYTPIRNVKYVIDNTRVEDKTNYEKLKIDITTDGTFDPEVALKEAAKILINHLVIITQEKIAPVVKVEKEEVIVPQVDDKVLMTKKLLKTPIEDLDLSVRAFNCLKSSKINYLKDLVKMKTNDLIKFRNFGQKSLTEIQQVILNKGLDFGMDLSEYNIDD